MGEYLRKKIGGAPEGNSPGALAKRLPKLSRLRGERGKKGDSEDGDRVGGCGDADGVGVQLASAVVPIGGDEQNTASGKLREFVHHVLDGVPEVEGVSTCAVRLGAMDG